MSEEEEESAQRSEHSAAKHSRAHRRVGANKIATTKMTRTTPTRAAKLLNKGQFVSCVLLFNFIICALITQQHIQLGPQEAHLEPSGETHLAAATRQQSVRHRRHTQEAVDRPHQEPTSDGREVEHTHRERHKRRRQRRRAKNSKRQAAVDLAINELHILESLDDQLQSFADSAAAVTRRQELEYRAQLARPAGPAGARQQVQLSQRVDLARGRQQVCSLNLIDGLRALQTNRRHFNQERPAGPAGGAPLNCLEERSLWRLIPPYVLNLYRQLIADLVGQSNVSQFIANYNDEPSGRAADQLGAFVGLAVQLMPYQAQVMRSFRQPPVRLRAHDHEDQAKSNYTTIGTLRSVYSGRRAKTNRGTADELRLSPAVAASRPSEQLIVELSTLPFRRDDDGGADNRHLGWRTAHDDTDARQGRRRTFDSDKSDNYDDLDRLTDDRAAERAPAAAGETTGACDFSQRLLAARHRNELCFWFNIDQQIQLKLNGTREQRLFGPDARGPFAAYTERLVEAELHLFKLPPQVMSAHEQEDDRWTMNKRRQVNETTHKAQKQSTSELNDRSRTTNLYHLKTNLLEVSLYQILPRKDTDKTTRSSETARARQANGRDHEYPLRLLDIRRIDLDSNGWETFYVKRAVEDWLRDERLNLGLVIKARSMFDEPIEIGLIRFADAYDHANELRGAPRRRAPSAAASNETNANFDLSHQPLLVIYTTTTSASSRVEPEARR